MQKPAINLLIILGLIMAAVLSIVQAIYINEFSTAIPNGVSVLLAYLILFAAAGLGLNHFRHRVGVAGILVPVVLTLVLGILPKALMSSMVFTLKFLPVIIAMALGIWSGYLYATKASRKFTPFLLIGAFPLIMALGPYGLWVHKLSFGTFSGELIEPKAVSFSMENREGKQVSEVSLRGKVVLLDFWYIGCAPCVAKFPKLQEAYEQYRDDPRVSVYAVNRPMRRDTAGQSFAYIEELGHSFPVLNASQEVIDAFGVTFYPTVTLLNHEGEVVFAGELEKAKQRMQAMLDRL